MFSKHFLFLSSSTNRCTFYIAIIVFVTPYNNNDNMRGFIQQSFLYLKCHRILIGIGDISITSMMNTYYINNGPTPPYTRNTSVQSQRLAQPSRPIPPPVRMTPPLHLPIQHKCFSTEWWQTDPLSMPVTDPKNCIPVLLYGMLWLARTTNYSILLTCHTCCLYLLVLSV